MKLYNLLFVQHDPATWGLVAWALSVPLYLALQSWFGFAWTGGWRKVALIPLVGVVLATILAVVASRLPVDAEPLDLNGVLAFPLVGLVMFAPFGFIYEVIAGVIHRSTRRSTGTASVA
jgi:hypothetical protein